MGQSEAAAGLPAGAIMSTAAGVPFVALPPENGPPEGAPVVLAWHLMDAPRTEVAMAAAVPLRTVPAWRVYFGLPMTGSRLPAGGVDEVMRLGYEDAVLNLNQPISEQAVAELPAALAELRERLPLGDGPVALLGGSAGSAVAGMVLTETELPVCAVALVSPVIALADAIAANERVFDVTYEWSAASRAFADRQDLLARVDEIAARDPRPAVLAVAGADDEAGFRDPARRLVDELAKRYGRPDMTRFVSVDGMGHAFADEPGVAAAPQRADAAVVDAAVSAWFTAWLTDRVRKKNE